MIVSSIDEECLSVDKESLATQAPASGEHPHGHFRELEHGVSPAAAIAGVEPAGACAEFAADIPVVAVRPTTNSNNNIVRVRSISVPPSWSALIGRQFKN
jgi:hypothetical protein